MRLHKTAQELLSLALSWPSSGYAMEWQGLGRKEQARWHTDTLEELANMGPIQGRLSDGRTWPAIGVMGAGLIQFPPRQLQIVAEMPWKGYARWRAPWVSAGLQ